VIDVNNISLGDLIIDGTVSLDPSIGFISIAV